VLRQIGVHMGLPNHGLEGSAPSARTFGPKGGIRGVIDAHD